MPDKRLSYEESCEKFKPDYVSEVPSLLDRMPRFDEASFRNTDLSQSCMCWNDFVDVDFTGADITRAMVARSQKKALALTPEQSAVVDWRWFSGPEPGGG